MRAVLTDLWGRGHQVSSPPKTRLERVTGKGDRSEPPEGAFGICSFWEAEYLALGGGTLEHARTAFEQLLTHANEVGLYSEEIDPHSGDALGNFPQAFTHIGLINAALSLHQRERGLRQLGHREHPAERSNQNAARKHNA